jgi:DNA-directed RNA polymerase specialized sigma24 family protein
MKATVVKALCELDLQMVIEKMNVYSTRRLQKVDVKQLEGREAEDFEQDSLVKAMDGTWDWQNAATDNVEEFLFGILRAEISNFLKKIGRRDIGLFNINEIENDEKEEL